MTYNAPKNFDKRTMPVALKALFLAAALVSLGLLLPRTGMPTQAAGNLGGARVTNVVGVGGSCASGPDGASTQFWEVAQGGTYDVTLSNVLDCGNVGTADNIQVIVQSSDTGNQCLTATKQSTGVYKFTITIPDPACNTMPIKYCTTNCSESTGVLARRNDGGDFQAHLRVGTFNESCVYQGPDTDCNGGGSLKGAISACKFYDFNANGQLDPGELPLDGWPMTLDPLDGAIPATATQLTLDGCVSWANLDPALNPYSVTEGTPTQLNWIHSTTNPVTNINVAAGQVNEVLFGNYCTVPSGGLTIGFWSNRNGQALITAADLAALDALCLRNADGSDFNPTTAVQVKNWLLSATATNMSYMLSAQLAAMTLNVRHNFVDPGAYDLCHSSTIDQLITDANTALCNDGLTPSGDPNRAGQEAMKNCLDALNNGGPVIPVTPCSYTFPTQ